MPMLLSWYVALVLSAQAPLPSVLESHVRARTLVEAALAAHGGPEVLERLQRVHVVMDGDQFWRHQSRRVDPPYDRERERTELFLDLPRGQLVTARWATFPGGAHRHTGTITDGRQGFSVNYRQGTYTAATQPPAAEQTNHLYALPQFVLRDLLASGRSLRSLGRLRLLSGAEVDAVAALAGGQLLTVGFDVTTGLVRATLNVGVDLVAGESEAEAEFVDYRAIGGVRMPSRRIVRAPGQVLRDLAYESITTGVGVPADRLSPPSAFADLTSAPPVEPVRTLAPGVWAVGGGSAALVVAFQDHVLVVDAPPNAQDILTRVAGLAPGKPVRFVIPTHHHDDHSAGVARFARAGATILTTPGNLRFMERIIGAGATGKVVALEAPTRVFEDPTRRVEVHRIDAGPHADEMVVAWIPALGILYQADLIDVGPSGATPPGTNNETTVHFAAWLRRQRWDVTVFAGSHGFLPSAEAFEALVKAPLVPLLPAVR